MSLSELPREKREDLPEVYAIAAALRHAHIQTGYEHDAYLDVAGKIAAHLESFGWKLRRLPRPDEPMTGMLVYHEFTQPEGREPA